MGKRYNLKSMLTPFTLIGEYVFYRPFVSFSTPLISLIEWGHDRIRTSSPETQPSFHHYLDMSREDLEVDIPSEKRTSTGDGKIEILAWREENSPDHVTLRFPDKL